MFYSAYGLKKRCAIATLGLTLGACGTTMSPSVGFKATPAAADSAGKTDTLATAAFKEITPQLVKEEQQARNNRATQDISVLVATPAPYAIESGDVLSIIVWDHPELTANAPQQAASASDPASAATPPAGFIVDHDGQIQFPYAGKLKVSGLTEEATRNLLAAKLARYIVEPNITLRVQSFRSKRIYVDGEVRQPGVHAISDIPMTLIEAINRAGGTLPSADQSRITLSRAGETYLIDLPQMVQRGVNPGSILLQNGDILRVRSRDESKVFVSGEVVAPRSLIMHNGRLSLNEALGESGGVNPMSGDAGQIYVVRRSGTEPVVFRLDASAPGALAMAESFELDPKDVVYVAATPLTNWHRTISQILPGALSSAFTAVTQPR
jgi:polysaccharide export outer membrane protein